MSYEDFFDHFGEMNVCKTRRNWLMCQIEGVFPAESARQVSAYKLVVEKPSLVNIGLYESNDSAPGKLNTTDLCLIVLRKENQLYKFVGASDRKLAKFVNYEAELTNGEYLVVPFSFSFWNRADSDNAENKYTLVFMSLEKLGVGEAICGADILAKSIIQMCSSAKYVNQPFGAGGKMYQTRNEDDGLIVVIENPQDTDWCVTYDDSNKYHHAFKVPKRSRKVALQCVGNRKAVEAIKNSIELRGKSADAVSVDDRFHERVGLYRPLEIQAILYGKIVDPMIEGFFLN